MAARKTTWEEVCERRRNNSADATTLDVICCNVGQGDCTILWLPDGKVVVIDCGSSSSGGAKAENVRARLPARWNAPLPIDVLVLSHPDKDHYNWLPDVLQDLTIRQVYHSWPMDQCTDRPFPRWWNGQLMFSANYGPVQALYVNDDDPAPDVLIDGGTFMVYAIASNVVVDETLVYYNYAYRKNTASIVVRAEFGNDVVIVAADATCMTEKFMLANEPKYLAASLRADVYRVGHHGSQSSSSPDFVDHVAPTGQRKPAAVISAAEQNTYGLPRKSVVYRVFNKVGTVDDDHWISYYPSDNEPCKPIVEDAMPQPLVTGPVQHEDIYGELWVTGVTGDQTFSLNGA